MVLQALISVGPELGYGADGLVDGERRLVPANAELEFEVELLWFEKRQRVTEDGGVVKAVRQEGEGPLRPDDGASVTGAFSHIAFALLLL